MRPSGQLAPSQHSRASRVWSFLSFPFLCRRETQSPLSPWPGPLLPNAAESRRRGQGGDEGPHHQDWKGAAEGLHGRGGLRAPLPTRQDSLGDIPNSGIEPRSPALQADSLPSEPSGKTKNSGVGSLSLLQGIFPTLGLNPGLLHCRQVLYQLSHQGSHTSIHKNENLFLCKS